VIGFAQEVNAASRRVLEKVGMTYIDTRLVKSIPTAFYRFERSLERDSSVPKGGAPTERRPT